MMDDLIRLINEHKLLNASKLSEILFPVKL